MSLEILLGPMFAGKSSAIHRIVNRYSAIGWPICCVTFSGDNRYSSEDLLMNHDKQGISCLKVNTLADTKGASTFQEAKLVIIDEAQFFPDLKEFVVYAVETLKKDVVLVGLDGDAERKPFGQILDCIPLADKVTKLKAFCLECRNGTEAIFTYCKSSKTEQVCVGGAELYMPLCRDCYVKNMA